MGQRQVRASEIADFAFCRRAWWYALKGEQSHNRDQLEGGGRWHHRHARQVLMAGLLRWVAYGLVVAALGLAVASLGSPA